MSRKRGRPAGADLKPADRQLAWALAKPPWRCTECFLSECSCTDCDCAYCAAHPEARR